MSARLESVQAFRHEALLYSGWEEFILGTLPFIRNGLNAHEAILVVVSAEKRAVLRTALDRDADRVLFADMAQVGSNPALIIPAWQAFVRKHGSTAAGLRGIGEPIWKGRPDDELAECQRHESLLNVAFAGGRPWRLLCPYDMAQLDEAVITEARKSHEFVNEAGTSAPSETFRGVEACREPFSQPLPEPDHRFDEFVFSESDLASVRDMALRQAHAARMPEPRARDLVAALNEIATNALMHGAGRCGLRIWRDQGKLICEVRNSGSFDHPLADRQEPGPEASSPRGLWLANQLCDMVQIRALSDGTAVRVHMRTDTGVDRNLMHGHQVEPERTDRLN
ncbi:MAG TPA: anti-sigma factor RsbA family regulatory protein [Candidatus Dormibacteraeota bacterium]|nr:anti-sigma factor RsbA family regulatory protein [Candidatus Dormibacteraeota bacterium]